MSINQNITDSIESNYMPYTAHVILHRALPEIDGFKPSQRRILYTMYKMGLLNSARKKSQGVVGQTMFLHPHGDISIYETLVRMSRDNEALLTPYIDSKGNFGKQYSREEKAASARYTEVRLEQMAKELFKDIDKDNVDMVDSYDGALKEPKLLPVTYPNILTNASSGTAVGMASNIPSFNLKEIIDFTVAYLKNKDAKVSDYILSPDFPTGANIIYDKKEMKSIYDTGRGSFKIRAKYEIEDDVITFTELPYTTTFEAIIEKISSIVKGGDLKEIVDVNDVYGINTKGIEIIVKKNTDKELLVEKLFNLTTLEDTYSCNFNLIVDGRPQTLGVKEIIKNWIIFRAETIKRGTEHDINKRVRQRHLLKGLEAILLDIDKVVSIIRETKKNSDVEKNLMGSFDIDEVQAEYIANIKLKHLNKEYILNRSKEIKSLDSDIKNLNKIISSKKELAKTIIDELTKIKEDFGKDRVSSIIDKSEVKVINMEQEMIDDYNVRVFVTKEGYLKKIPLTSLRGAYNNRLKDGDEFIAEFETTNTSEILFFTDSRNVHKRKLYEIEDSRPSNLGEFIPSLLSLSDEELIYTYVTEDFKGSILFGFDDGRVARVDLKSYETLQNRLLLRNAYADKNVLFVKVLPEGADIDLLAISDIDKAIILNTSRISSKATRTTAGVWFMRGKDDSKVKGYYELEDGHNYKYYKQLNAGVGKYVKKDDFINITQE